MKRFNSWTCWRKAQRGMRAYGVDDATVRLVGAAYYASWVRYWRFHRRYRTARPAYRHVTETLQVLVEGLGVADADVLQAAVLFYFPKAYIPDRNVRTLATLAENMLGVTIATDGRQVAPAPITTEAGDYDLAALADEPRAVQLCLADYYVWVQSGLSRLRPMRMYRDLSLLLPVAEKAGLQGVLDLWAPWVKGYEEKELTK